jgi:hypothetical protein
VSPIAQSAASFEPLRAGRRFWRELRLVQRLLEEHRAAAVARFGASAVDVIDLPSIASPGELDPAQIRAAGALLWASEVEAAGLPSFVDGLAERVLEGKLLLDITTAGDRLMLYRRARTQRFSPGERAAIYGRIFDAQFQEAWTRLLRALDAIARAPRQENLSAPIARAVAVARDVALQLSQRSGGIASYAARSIADQVHAALGVLRDPDLMRALGGADPWQMMRLHAAEVLGRPLDPEPHLDRAGAALRICNWLAAASPTIEAGTPHLPPPDALDAAELWLASGSAP